MQNSTQANQDTLVQIAREEIRTRGYIAESELCVFIVEQSWKHKVNNKLYGSSATDRTTTQQRCEDTLNLLKMIPCGDIKRETYTTNGVTYREKGLFFFKPW